MKEKFYEVYLEWNFGNYTIKIFEDGKVIRLQSTEDINVAINTLREWTYKVKVDDIVIEVK